VFGEREVYGGKVSVVEETEGFGMDKKDV